MNGLINFLSSSFSNCTWLAILLVAFCPLLESKIALPLALNNVLWSRALSPFPAFLITFIGSSIPCLFVIFLIRKLKSRTICFISSKLANKYSAKAKKLDKFSTFQKYLTLIGFSALPLPLTGVWSSSVIAGLTDLKIGYSVISIILGNLISCGITITLCCYFKNSIGNICLISIGLVILFLILDLVVNVLRGIRTKSHQTK